MGKEKDEAKDDQSAATAAVKNALMSGTFVPSGSGYDASLVTALPNGQTPDDEAAVPAYKAKLAFTPDYLQPKMKIDVGEPAIYRSLFILDTLDNSTDTPIAEEILFDLSESWRKTGGLGEMKLETVDSTTYFQVSGNPVNGKFGYHPSLLKGGSVVSFKWGDKLDAKFSFDIRLKTSKDRVLNVAVRKKDHDSQPATFDGTSAVVVPINEPLDGSAVRLDMERLVQKLVQGDTLAEMQELSLTLNSAGTLAIRDFKVSKSATHSFKELESPIDPFDPALSEAQTKPAMGVLMVHKQSWKQSGLALGNLLNSVCLAPGEVTRIAVTDWRRTSRGSKQAITEQGETVTSQIEQSRAVNEVQAAVARDAQYGGSSMFAASASAQAGFAMSTLLASGSASAASTASSALTASFSGGEKNLSASSQNAINQRTAEKSQSLRSRRQSVVQEVSEKESETMSTRILANYNRRHSLNIEYFEVLQLYTIETELSGWERCLFVPLVPLNFVKDGKADLEVIKRHRPQLIGIYRDLGAQQMVERLLRLEDAQTGLAKAEDAIQKTIALLQEAFAYVAQGLALFAMSLDPASKDQAILSLINLRDELRNKYNTLATKLGGTLPAIDHPQSLSMIEQLVKEQVNKLASLKIDLGEVLNADRMFLSQQIWLRMSPYRIYSMLQGYHVKGQPISMLVEPYPVGVFGNYVAFRWGFPRSNAGQKARLEFERNYLKQENTTGQTQPGDAAQQQGEAASNNGGATASQKEKPTTVALPTSGVFAEAVLGAGVAAEVKDEFHFGRWGEDVIPILPPEIKAIRSRDRARDMDLSTSDFSDPLVRLRSKDIANLSYIDQILSKVGEFRDMSGLSETGANLRGLAKMASKGATAAGDRAVQLHSKMLDTFVEVLNSDVFKAAAAECLAPGAGPALLQATGGGSKKKAAAGADKPGDSDPDDDDGDGADNAVGSGNAAKPKTTTGGASNAAAGGTPGATTDGGPNARSGGAPTATTHGANARSGGSANAPAGGPSGSQAVGPSGESPNETSNFSIRAPILK